MYFVKYVIKPFILTGNNNNLSTLASSSENMKSLSRLFPHLSKDLSNSMPADMQVDDATPTTIGANNGSMHKSPNSILDQDLHDLSAASSVTSSFSRSAIGKFFFYLHTIHWDYSSITSIDV